MKESMNESTNESVNESVNELINESMNVSMNASINASINESINASMNQKTVDVIIPTYKPTNKLKRLLFMLKKQSYPVNQIILINTEEKYFQNLFYGTGFLEQFSNLLVRHISEYEFDHGGTRRLGVSLSHADYFIFMTDDAIPMNYDLVQELIQPLEEGRAVLSYGRQCTAKRCSEIERFTRRFNYPNQSFVKTKEDLPRLGIKTYFCSDVCAAYRRDIYEELGGFVKQTIFNEDMLYAAKVIQAGYPIAYVASARVRHQHYYTNLQQLKRNFDLGVSQAKHPEVFAEVPPIAEGKKLVQSTAKHLKQKGLGKRIPELYITSAYKFLGFQLGKHYKQLPRRVIRSLTMNPGYWWHEDREANYINPLEGYGRSEVEDSWNPKKAVAREKKITQDPQKMVE